MGQRTDLQLLSSRALSNCCPAAARWPELMELAPVDSAEKDSPADVCLDRPTAIRPLSFLLLGLTAAHQNGVQSSRTHQDALPWDAGHADTADVLCKFIPPTQSWQLMREGAQGGRSGHTVLKLPSEAAKAAAIACTVQFM